MDAIDKEILWRQFGAALDMFGDTLRDCPDQLWGEGLWEDQAVGTDFSSFWYLGYHTLFWVDLYLTGAEEGFAPPAPFELVELDPAGRLPSRVHTRDELLAYLAHCRQKCQEIIGALSNEKAYQVCRFPWGEMPFVELQLYNLRHVQEHGAQLRMFLGQRVRRSARWIGRAK